MLSFTYAFRNLVPFKIGSNPSGVGLGSGQAAPTPVGGCDTGPPACAGVVATPAPESELTFDNVMRAGITTARIIEFEDNRGARHGSFEVDQSLKDFFPEGLPLRNELPDVTISAHVQAFKKGDPADGVPTFIMAILDSTATFTRTVEIKYDEAEQLGYQPSCTDPDAGLQPRTFYVPETFPPKFEPAIVEGQVFTDFSTRCGSNIGRGSSLSLWLTARDTRDLLEIVDEKRASLLKALDFHGCIDPGTRSLLETELQEAAAAFDAYEETGDAAQQRQSIRELDDFIRVADANTHEGVFSTCNATLNVGGALIARAESAKFMISKVVIVPLIVIKRVVNNNGGTAVAGDFTVSVAGNRRRPATYAGEEAPGRMVGLRPGAYSVSEVNVFGYADYFSPDCLGTIAAGETKTCTITNDDIPPKLTLIKHVINNNSGTAVTADFTVSAFGATPTPISGAGGATSDATFWQGRYTLSETGPPGYAPSAWSCAGEGAQVGNQIVLRLSEVAACEITNDDIP